MVYQQLHIVAQRHRVLQELVDYRANGWKVHYQDETWCNAHHTKECVWMLESDNLENIDPLVQDIKWKGGLKVHRHADHTPH